MKKGLTAMRHLDQVCIGSIPFWVRKAQIEIRHLDQVCIGLDTLPNVGGTDWDNTCFIRGNVLGSLKAKKASKLDP